MRKGKVYVNDVFAGVISEEVKGFSYTYNKDYLQRNGALPVSLTLPLQEEAFLSKTLFSFFDGLIPEGWLLNIAERNWKISRYDRMGLLLACCKDCIGNVSIEPIKQEER